MESLNDDLIYNLQAWRRLYRALKHIFVPRPVAERITRLGQDYRLLLDQYMDSTEQSVKAFCLSQLCNLSQQMRQVLLENQQPFADLKLTIKSIDYQLDPSEDVRARRTPSGSQRTYRRSKS